MLLALWSGFWSWGAVEPAEEHKFGGAPYADLRKKRRALEEESDKSRLETRADIEHAIASVRKTKKKKTAPKQDTVDVGSVVELFQAAPAVEVLPPRARVVAPPVSTQEIMRAMFTENDDIAIALLM